MNELQQREYLIPEWRRSELEDRIQKLGKRAGKLDLDAPTFEVTDTVDQQVYVDGELARHVDGTPVTERWLLVVVTEPVVALPGYEFLGTIQHTEHGNILRTVPGMGVEEGELGAYRSTSSTLCDHCGTRRVRKDTYLVRNAEGVLQVGSTCITDFLGVDRLASLQWKLSSLGCEDLERPSCGRAAVVVGIERYLGAVATAIRTVGWTSRGQAYDGHGTATADVVRACLWAYTREQRETAEANYPEVYEALRDGIPAQDQETAAAALAWARAIDPGTTSDYLHNLRVACASEDAEARSLGIVASAVAAHAREVEREIKRANEARLAQQSDWIGNAATRSGASSARRTESRGVRRSTRSTPPCSSSGPWTGSTGCPRW